MRQIWIFDDWGIGSVVGEGIRSVIGGGIGSVVDGMIDSIGGGDRERRWLIFESLH